VLVDDIGDPFVDGLLNQGRAEMLLELLETRFSVPTSIRKRIEACTDTAQIKAWFERAISASSLDEVFAELRVRVPRVPSRLIEPPAAPAWVSG
jgi:hypothetical protein